MTSRFCPQCGAEITGEFKFCPSCGSKLPDAPSAVEAGGTEDNAGRSEGEHPRQSKETREVLRCPTCGYTNLPGARSCESCGSFLGSAEPEYVEDVSPAPQAEEPHEERRPKASQQTPRKKEGKKGRKHPVKKPAPAVPKGFHLESYQTVAILAAVIVGGILIYGLMSSKQAPPIGGPPPSQQTSSSTQPSAQVIHEINRLKEIVNKEPNDVGSLLTLSNMLQDNKFYDQAAVYYKRYLTKVPKNVDARVDYGVTLFEGGNTQGAITEIKDALKIDPRHQIGLFNLGIIYLNSGDLEKANAAFKDCVKVNPNSEIAKKAEQILEQHAKITSQEVK